MTKILSHETTIFGSKMMEKSGLEIFYFEILRAPSEVPASLLGQGRALLMDAALDRTSCSSCTTGGFR